MPKPVVFIHTNNQQLLGALLGMHSMKSRSRHPDKFDVRLLLLEDTPHLYKREGQQYLRKGRVATWHNRDLQSFSPLRRMVPQAMGFQGRALVTDPDVFAIGDIYELLARDMGDKSVICRYIADGYKGNKNPFYASSVMLLDCSRLIHWQWDRHIDEIFAKERDYGPWISLLDEPADDIGELEKEWNSFDNLTERTKLLHCTERSTQPWKTGLPIDYDMNIGGARQAKIEASPTLVGRLKRLISGAPKVEPPRYKRHPDSRQERLFFTLLRESLDAKVISEDFLRKEIRQSHLRSDALEMLNTIEP